MDTYTQTPNSRTDPCGVYVSLPCTRHLLRYNITVTLLTITV